MSPSRTVVIYATGIVLAFSWGLYYVVVSALGFQTTLTIEMLAVTAIAAAGLVGMELYYRRKRSSSAEIRPRA